MSRTYRRKETAKNNPLYVGEIDSEIQHNLGGFDHHRWCSHVAPVEKYRKVFKREKAHYHRDGARSLMGGAPRLYRRMYHRTERAYARMQIHSQVRFEYEDFDVVRLYGPNEATWAYW